jgi:acetyl esterase/lipase
MKTHLMSAALALNCLAGERLPEMYNLALWPAGEAPLARGNGPLDNPFLTVILPPEDRRNGSAIVVAPGGGNIMLMYGSEGLEVAEKFAEWGFAAFVLTYRLSPRYGDDARVADAKRAIALVRSKAAEFQIDPKRVGLAGFSAGGTLGRAAAAASTGEEMPGFLVLVYGAGAAKPGEDLTKFPPTYLFTAAWDQGAVDETMPLFEGLNKAKAVVQLSILQKGRHGFGAGTFSEEYGEWMGSLRHFLKVAGFIPEGKR